MNIIDRKFNDLVYLIKSLDEKELYHIIRTGFDNINYETKKSCSDFFNKFNYWGVLDIENNNYEEIKLKQEELTNHIDDFVWLYNHLCDNRSKYVLYSILNNWCNYDFNLSSRTKEYMYDDYFDLDIVKDLKEEVIVDLGAYIGDTVISYINNYGEDSYKKIYCYEITKEAFEALKQNTKIYKNIEYRLKGVGDKEEIKKVLTNKESISANTIDENGNEDVLITTLDVDIKEKITIIKADIEGYEQKALIGAKNHIINDHPKLLISVYHRNEDLWKIPKMIYEMDKKYKFYLRYNSSPIYPTEITLLAI